MTTTPGNVFPNIFKHTIRLPKVDYNETGRKNCGVEIEVEIREREQLGLELSICGAIWNPRHTDHYSGGQNLEEIAKLYPANVRVQRIIEIWRRWHLNTMRAGCEHQRTNWDTDSKVTPYTWDLNFSDPDIRGAYKALRDAEHILRTNGVADLDEEVRRILALPLSVTTTTDEAPPGYKSANPHVRVESINWVRQSDHPAGILAKSCEECGYKYGTAWITEELPPEIVTEIKSLCGVKE